MTLVHLLPEPIGGWVDEAVRDGWLVLAEPQNRREPTGFLATGKDKNYAV